MIREVSEAHIAECVQVIRESFATVADAFGITVENAPRFTAFATTEDVLRHQLLEERRWMFAFWWNEEIAGYYSLARLKGGQCELNHLCVRPAYRHQGIGEALLLHAFEKGKALGFGQMKIGIVEENRMLRKWYEAYGFMHTGTKKFEHFPFTCGFMEKELIERQKT